MFNFMVYFSVISVYLIHCVPCKYNIKDYDRGGADLSYLGSSVFGKPNEESGNRVKQWNESSEVNPEELGTYAEGDILFPESLSRNGMIAETMRWPSGVVPFEITGSLSSEAKRTIKKSMMVLHNETCIRFRRRKSDDSAWISITNTNTGCWATLGRVGGGQGFNLQEPECLSRIGTTMHELLHVLGFNHEHSRSDRDSYITIHWENVEQGMERHLQKSDKKDFTSFGVSYDYGSVVHYPKMAFSINDLPTITVKKDPKIKIGQRKRFSENDLEKVRQMYNCSKTSIKDNSTEVDIDI
ncbi:hypothetical protein ILUMI_23302 [Ignelater luminosus]|uniref:Metalloendopeptidase n=1 Tax=Ignelater luminosus TaxID=2038154 RepID=A0A8K0CFE7_IGNLU|nr:hypothetical protein ILUMI_23302 [Ignelater luminosus]